MNIFNHLFYYSSYFYVTVLLGLDLFDIFKFKNNLIIEILDLIRQRWRSTLSSSRHAFAKLAVFLGESSSVNYPICD